MINTNTRSHPRFKQHKALVSFSSLLNVLSMWIHLLMPTQNTYVSTYLSCPLHTIDCWRTFVISLSIIIKCNSSHYHAPLWINKTLSPGTCHSQSKSYMDAFTHLTPVWDLWVSHPHLGQCGSLSVKRPTSVIITLAHPTPAHFASRPHSPTEEKFVHALQYTSHMGSFLIRHQSHIINNMINDAINKHTSQVDNAIRDPRNCGSTRGIQSHQTHQQASHNQNRHPHVSIIIPRSSTWSTSLIHLWPTCA